MCDMDKKIGCVVLNYNDAGTTIRQVRRIRDYRCFRYVVVVDNHSTDGSWRRLQELRGAKVRLLRARGNHGYGAGNNLGIRYCREELGLDHVVVANPDTIFRESCVEGLYRAFGQYPGVAAAAGLMYPVDVKAPKGGAAAVPSFWPLQPWFLDLLETGPICRRVFKKSISYPVGYGRGYRVVPVGAVHGSMVMFDVHRLEKCGDYDEDLFLYCEEKALGMRIAEHGYRTVVVKDVSFLHAHSVSISKTYRSVSSRQRLLHASKLYYYRKYLHISRFEELAVRLFFRAVMLEIWFCKQVLKLSW